MAADKRIYVMSKLVMAILVISVSSDSSKDSVGTPAGRVILFGTIPATIPDTTLLRLTPQTAIHLIHHHHLPMVHHSLRLPFLLRGHLQHLVHFDVESWFLHRDSLPYGRPYRYHLNGPVHMRTARKRVGPLPTQRLAMRHSVDYSSSDHFSSDDSSSVSSSSSSLETSSDSPADALSDSASSHSSSDHSLSASPSGTRSSHRLCSLVPSVHRSSAISERPSHDSSSASRSRKRSRLPVASVPLSSPTLGALSYERPDLLPSPKRIRSSETATDLENCSEDRFEPYVPREVKLGVDFKDESSEPSRSRGADLEMDVDVVRSDRIKIDPKIQAEIDEYFAYADALRDRGIDTRVVVEAADQKESETGMRGPVEVRVEMAAHPIMPEDTPEPAQEGAGHRIVGAESAVTVLTERVAELERDNRRLRGTASVESERVDRLQRGMARMQRELRQIRRF
ncbi:hypothetical protein Tco_0211475 [Tanacetum coccineum]